MTQQKEDFNPEIRIVPVPCPNCGDCNMEAYRLGKEDMMMNCWECGFENHTNIYEWEWDDFYEEETSVDLSSFKQRIANGERAKDVIETYHVIGKLDRKELLEYEERFNKEE